MTLCIPGRLSRIRYGCRCKAYDLTAGVNTIRLAVTAAEAEQIKQEASDQAKAVRQAAEFEVAEVHTAVMSMQTELNEFAARLTDTLPGRAVPRTPPAGSPAACRFRS